MGFVLSHVCHQQISDSLHSTYSEKYPWFSKGDSLEYALYLTIVVCFLGLCKPQLLGSANHYTSQEEWLCILPATTSSRIGEKRLTCEHVRSDISQEAGHASASERSLVDCPVERSDEIVMNESPKEVLVGSFDHVWFGSCSGRDILTRSDRQCDATAPQRG